MTRSGVMMRGRRDGGETLIEIVLTIVILSMTITALVASMATAANAGSAQRRSVQLDVALRNYAEATKAGAQSCVENGYYAVTVPVEAGITFSGVAATGNICPSPTAAPTVLTLRVDGPSGSHASMQVAVRTP
jgi:type II secretory pathway pseudopilin PulG